MIYSLCHPGSGVGNQLHRYIAGRVRAEELGVPFSVVGKEYSKVKSFMNLNYGENDYMPHHVEEGSGKLIPHSVLPLWEEKTNYYNPEFNFIPDNSIIDGEFQDERYYDNHLSNIDDWLRVEPLVWNKLDEGGLIEYSFDTPDDLCVIGFRGGEFALFPELFLGDDYWGPAIAEMQKINPSMRFQVHTDDPVLAEKYFNGHYEVIHDVGRNWRAMRYAKYAIIANSSFYILPRKLLHHKDWSAVTIAPRYWARRNIKEWSMPQNYYKCFTYL